MAAFLPKKHFFAHNFKTIKARRLILVSRNRILHMSFPMEQITKLSEVWNFSKWPLLGPKIYIFAHNFKTIKARRLILLSGNRFWHMSFPMEQFLKLSDV